MSRRDRQPVPPTGVVAPNRHDRKRAAVHHPLLGAHAGYACTIAGPAARPVSPSGLTGPPGERLAGAAIIIAAERHEPTNPATDSADAEEVAARLRRRRTMIAMTR
ncbi:hypothetical protein [Frankia sp. ACN1ag]|uniref:hypothetical protein n=1 Tax=Frankia sp. ACN1ag TaxID=102891 RepID=UPI0006DC037B|nr:hypothetical protein [Frankia sp. ACN1ag]KQC36837.1 hypothetical protein UK82_18790 [Frankia sp. ACN1ag]